MVVTKLRINVIKNMNNVQNIYFALFQLKSFADLYFSVFMVLYNLEALLMFHDSHTNTHAVTLQAV